MIVILEGLDNCGKNTIADMLCREKPEIIRIDFPDYTTDFGKFIKQQLFDNTLPPISLQLLFSSERLSKANYLQDIANSHLVITTRYTYTAMAYGIARGIDKSLLELLEADMPLPDKKIYISISVEESIARSNNPDLFEKDKNLLKRVEKEYKRIINSEADWNVVNGMLDLNNVYKSVQEIIFSV